MMQHKKIELIKDSLIGNEELVIQYLKNNGYKNIQRSRMKLEGVGVPDIYLYDESGKKIYIEIKCNGDALRRAQIEWIERNKNIDVIILWVTIIDKTIAEKWITSVCLSQRQLDFFDSRCIDINKFCSNIIDKAIILDEQDKDILKVLQDEIDGKK